MIVVSTDRTSTEKVLHEYARNFFSSLPNNGTSFHLEAPGSISKNVEAELQNRAGVAFFFFGHGLNPPAIGFLGSNQKPAIDAKTIRLLAKRKVAATCCYGDRVGRVARKNKFSVFGYKGEYWVPESPLHIADSLPAALAGPMVISNGGSPSD